MWFCSMPCYLYVTNFVDAVNAYVRLGDQSQICTSAATDLGGKGPCHRSCKYEKKMSASGGRTHLMFVGLPLWALCETEENTLL